MRLLTFAFTIVFVWTGLNSHILYKTRELRFSRSVSKDNGGKLARWLHSHVQ